MLQGGTWDFLTHGYLISYSTEKETRSHWAPQGKCQGFTTPAAFLLCEAAFQEAHFTSAMWWLYRCQQMIHGQLVGKSRLCRKVPYGDTSGFLSAFYWVTLTLSSHVWGGNVTQWNWFTKATYRNQCDFFSLGVVKVHFLCTLTVQRRLLDMARERASLPYRLICCHCVCNVYILLSVTKERPLWPQLNVKVIFLCIRGPLWCESKWAGTEYDLKIDFGHRDGKQHSRLFSIQNIRVRSVLIQCRAWLKKNAKHAYTKQV